MKAANIFHDLRNISSKDIITKNELLKLLKKYCKIISPYDLMLATARMREEGKYVQANYREKYLEVYVKYFIMRVKEILDNNNYLDEAIDKESFDESFNLLKYQFEKENYHFAPISLSLSFYHWLSFFRSCIRCYNHFSTFLNHQRPR